MELKDFVTISISALAFILSAIATFISTIRGRYEEQRAIRNQLSETLNRIANTNIENAKLYHDTATKDPAYYQQLSAMMNQQQASLLNQAMYLADQIPKLVTAVEMNTIAVANFNAGDVIMAEKYYRKAIEVSPNNYYRALAIRSYAGFLYTQRQFEEGRNQFQQSIKLISGGDNLSRYTNGYTYQMWAWNELNNAGVQSTAEQYFENAQSQFKNIDNDAVRENAMNTLAEALPTLAKKKAAGAAAAAASG